VFRMRSLLLVLTLSAVSGCATEQTPSQPTSQTLAPPASASIKLEEGGCGYIAACPAYVIVMKPDGSYRYEGYKNVAVIGMREGKLADGAWADAENAFATFGWSTLIDPTSRQGGFPCMPDSPFARITRDMGEDDRKVFSYNLGCDSAAGDALLSAMKGVLPIPAQ
jgi:Domain of unknown function (DUF6438)